MSTDKILMLLLSIIFILFSIGLIFSWTKTTKEAEHLTEKQKKFNILMLKIFGIISFIVGIAFAVIAFII